MNGRATNHFLILGLIGLAAVFAGLAVLRETTRFKPKKWLAEHREIAELYARSTLAGQSNAIPGSLSDMKVESRKDWVSFGILVGPFFSHGMLFSISGDRPEQGLGGEPEIKKWEHVEGNWYYWVAD